MEGRESNVVRRKYASMVICHISKAVRRTPYAQGRTSMVVYLSTSKAVAVSRLTYVFGTYIDDCMSKAVRQRPYVNGQILRPEQRRPYVESCTSEAVNR